MNKNAPFLLYNQPKSNKKKSQLLPMSFDYYMIYPTPHDGLALSFLFFLCFTFTIYVKDFFPSDSLFMLHSIYMVNLKVMLSYICNSSSLTVFLHCCNGIFFISILTVLQCGCLNKKLI
jgi:hypothetical protein